MLHGKMHFLIQMDRHAYYSNYFFRFFFPDFFTLTGSEAMFADLGHFNPRSIQVIFYDFWSLFQDFDSFSATKYLSLISIFFVILVTDSFSIHNLPIFSSDLCGADSIPDQESQRS